MPKTSYTENCFFTDRLFMQPIRQEDKSLYLQLYTCKDMMKFISDPLSKEQMEKIFERVLADWGNPSPQILTWSLIEKSSNTLIGFLGFIVKSQSAGEMGMMLSAQSQGKRYSIEALEGLINYGFEKLNYAEIHASFNKNNLKSCAIVERFGFSKLNTDSTNESQYYLLVKNNWRGALPFTG